MKIQNKSAKLWITLGLLGLIMFGIRSAIGSFGGIIIELWSDAGIIFLLIGIYLESKNKKKDSSQGFISPILLVIIGIAVIGGTMATFAIKSKNPELAAPKTLLSGTIRDQNEPGEIISKNKEVVPVKIETRAVTQKNEVITIKNETRVICQSSIIQGDGSNSLSGNIKTLCEKIISNKYNQEETDNISRSIQEKWKLLQITQKAEESSMRRTEDIKTMYGDVQD